tara:strand:+ start:8096 stop:8827 length:732 start_codon:yes stop_codon:yes gene_type:complete
VLDDFGTGYYGLGDLGRYPLETVKIDKSFVSGPKASSLNASLVKTIVFMANHCGMKTIAEGIDTPEQEAFVRDTGCTHGQGFLFSRPTSVADIIALMAPPSPSPTASWNESVSVSGHAPSGARESSLCPAMHYRGAWSSIVVARCPLPVARCPLPVAPPKAHWRVGLAGLQNGVEGRLADLDACGGLMPQFKCHQGSDDGRSELGLCSGRTGWSRLALQLVMYLMPCLDPPMVLRRTEHSRGW